MVTKIVGGFVSSQGLEIVILNPLVPERGKKTVSAN